MPLTHFYVSGEGSTNQGPADHYRLRWPTAAGESDTVKSAIGWWLPSLGPIPTQAIDLVRIAGGAYLVDRLSGRPSTFTRRLHLTVEVADPARWEGEAIDQLAQLLFWLTGDTWEFRLIQDPTTPETSAAEASDRADAVALLSGGLDSYLGALHLLSTLSEPPLFVGHYDTATAVRRAQNTVHNWLQAAYAPPPSYTQMGLPRERLTRLL